MDAGESASVASQDDGMLLFAWSYGGPGTMCQGPQGGVWAFGEVSAHDKQ